jgi:hypothetical protein
LNEVKPSFLTNKIVINRLSIKNKVSNKIVYVALGVVQKQGNGIGTKYENYFLGFEQKILLKKRNRKTIGNPKKLFQEKNN